MSIKEMIQDHPAVGADYTEELGEAVKHAMYCAAIASSCVDACNAENGDMSECIRKCSDASDICQAVSTVAARRTHGNTAVIKSLLEACILACKVCAEECDKHDNPHCQRCARMCHEVVEDCVKARDAILDAV
jgi:hypothetical protein